jgi:hypothetical protein
MDTSLQPTENAKLKAAVKFASHTVLAIYEIDIDNCINSDWLG